MDRGDLNALKDTITNKQFAQDWALDATGNWRNFREDDDGDGTWDLDQQRTANKVNEITDIIEALGPSWATPVYDKAGNMTTIPKPADPTASFTATYDAWNRLVQITEGATTVARYEYDGAKRRVVKKTYSGGVLDETRYSFFTEPSKWQVVEERVDSSSDAERQFVWGLRYIDDIVERDRDTTDDGTLDERLYGMQDANWNVTGIADTAGSVQERYAYSAYGVSVVMTAGFSSRASSSVDWEVTFAGYRWDKETECFYVRVRVYQPALGRWLSRDSAGYLVGPNLYAYARPTVFTDPSGNAFIDPRIPSRVISRILNSMCPLVQSNLVTCGCCMVEAADLLAGGAGLVLPREIPFLDEALNILDCACDAGDMLNAICVVWNGTGTIWTAIGMDAVATISCMINIVDIAEVTGLLWDRIFVFVELILAHAQAQFIIAGGCTPCGPACQSLL